MSESRRLQIRVDDEFRAKLEEAAAAKKLNVSEWVRGVLERALRAKSTVRVGRPPHRASKKK